MASFYSNSLSGHQNTTTGEIYSAISTAYSKRHLDQKNQQSTSWTETIEILKSFYSKALPEIKDLSQWGILYEYAIPRRSKRIDAILLSKNLIFVIEIKNNQRTYANGDITQLEDYCLDLRDFHFESRNKIIVPILLSTDAPNFYNHFSAIDDFVQTAIYANRQNLADVIINAQKKFGVSNYNIDLHKWDFSKYFPTPTIIEAARTLYSKKDVSQISRNHAGVENLTNTTSAVLSAIKKAQKDSSKIICFITGVPGAGKTLVGLNIVHNKEFQNNGKEMATFLSGNSPLVKVLSESLARDFNKREKVKKTEAKREVKTFLHNVHEFVEEYYGYDNKLPSDHVIIYDEAQRAWTKEHKTRKSKGAIKESEPEILLSIMDRLPDWGVIIALVGGGQEINTGEAGLREWGKSIESKFSHWKVYISSELKYGDHSTANQKLFEVLPPNVSIIEDSNLHLGVAIRSYKAQKLSHWVSLVLEGKYDEANEVLVNDLMDYPVLITRDIAAAKTFLKSKGRGTRRTGMIASSGGRRLKAHGYDPYHGLRGDSSQDELGNWYLNSPKDVRSSNFLEIVGTEYAVQGLELDWAGLLWDCDFRRGDNEWIYKQFKGTKWQNVGSALSRQFVLNKYRVLLTRAREGIVICVPHGDDNDETRLTAFYNETFEYLIKCGAKQI